MSAWDRFAGGFPGWITGAALAVLIAACGDSGTSGSGQGAAGAGGTTGSGAGGTTTSTTSGGGGAGGACGEITQITGDCKKNVCKDGAVTSVSEDTDLPNDANDCTTDACVDGKVMNTPVAKGAPCTQSSGKVCDAEGACVACVANTDCLVNEVCTAANECQEGSCGDLAKNNDETDVDCGGSCGATCAPGQSCSTGADCLQGVCKQNVCLVPTCGDGVENGTETDVDCGGSCASSGFNPKKCGPDQGCLINGDCAGNECSGTTCVPNCFDKVKDNGESAVDCGGPSCPACNDGKTCDTETDCASGHCATGVCCDTPCDGECDACTSIAKGSGPDGTCGAAKVGLLCGPAPTCANGEQTTQGACDGGGTCLGAGVKPCSPYVCDAGGTCKSACAGDGDCAAPATCAAGACTLPGGEPCAVAADCVSGSCADGFCCDTACDTGCQACSAAKKGSGADGTCGDVLTGTDPDSECAGLLNCGAGKCQIGNGQACVQGADCASGNCADGVCCNGPCTGTCLACTAAKKGGGFDGTCGNIPINSDPDSECTGSASCNGSGACSLAVNGNPCALGAECASGNCVDSVCCNTACTSACQACTAVKKGAGLNGLCGTIASGTDPDDECPGANVCAAGGCKLPNGEACVSGASCFAGFCVDGVCCDGGCLGTCQACTAAKKGSGADGACGAIAVGTDPDNECGGPTTCSGAGTCALGSTGTPCALGVECTSGFCADGVCCDTACGGNCQACTGAKKGSGTNGTCGPIASTTDPDNECAGATACNGAGVCALLANGGACSLSSECTSGFCADGVCCNTACTTTCQACSAVKKGQGADGTCGGILVGTDPDAECPGPTSCNGVSSCALLANGAVCGNGSECSSSFCVDGVCCGTVCNSPCQACTAAKKGSGADGSCASIASGTDPDSECAGSLICNGAGLCKSPTGDACSAATDCLSGFCVDGVCCNAVCTGACQACTAAKKGNGVDGTCSTIVTGTDPDNECGGAANCNGAGACGLFALGAPCAQNSECASTFCVDGVCCNGACNTSCQACTFAKKGSGTDGTCGSIASGADPDSECAGPQICNGAGACKAPLAEPCALGTDCLSGSCADGVCCNTACNTLCNACTATKKGSGADGTCGTIATGTDPDSECFGAFSCNGAGACSLLAAGAPCAANGECASTFCVDGVCCNGACNSLCNTCLALKKGSGADGTCGIVATATDPDNECPGTLVCNSAAQCKSANGDACVLGTDCTSGACVDGVCCNTTCTGACQACTATKKGSGTDGVCGSIAISTDPDSECFGAISCNGAGACATLALGATCTANGECANGFCVDGVCCNTACNALCNACTAVKKGSGADGTCAAVAANLDPDAECAGSLVCNGASLCKSPIADPCLQNTDCVSGFCADGVCCNAACTGACQACTTTKKGSGADGACGNIAISTDPDSECFGAITCNGAGACGALPAGAVCSANGECASSFCVDGVCCNSACNTLCNACTAVKKGSGPDGTCGVVAANLDPDNECAGALACNGASLCKLPNGEACALGTDCVSGACADGVCCNTTCTGVCNACTAAKKGSGADGTCGIIAVGLDPDNECGGAASCSGAASCALFVNGTPCNVNNECSSNSCVDGVCCNTACNTLCNACTAAKKNSGADGTCGVIPVGNDPDAECAGAAACSGVSTCSLFANGTACSINGECANGNCVDGFCCNTACSGTCQACSAAKKGSGANGACGNVATSTDPDLECPGATSCNAVAVCALFVDGAVCSINGECASGNCVDGVCCNTGCDGLCQACVGAKTSVSDGTCADVVIGTDPDNECSDVTSSPNCGGSLTCGP